MNEKKPLFFAVEQVENQKGLKGKKYTDCKVGLLLLRIVFFPAVFLIERAPSFQCEKAFNVWM